MAGDWIKMRLDLQTHPKVVRILSATKADKFRVVGGLHAVWSVFDTHSADGRLSGYTPDAMDHIIGWTGFSSAMISVGWLAYDGAETLMLPEFDEHNGKSGKRRAEDQKRKRDERKSPQSVRNLSEDDADENGTREEKRREEKEDKSLSGKTPDDQGSDQDNEDRRSGKPRKQGSNEDFEAARWMFGQVLAVNPTAKSPKWESWADDIRKLREIDGRTHREICELFKWAKHDNFWCSNIQSPVKLREKWDQLTERRMQDESKAPKAGNGRPSINDIGKTPDDDDPFNSMRKTL